MLAWFATTLNLAGVDLRLNADPTVQDLRSFDAVVIATGVRPRAVDLPGLEQAKSYVDVLLGAKVGKAVAIIGAGGIGFDVATYLSQHGESATLDAAAWRREWGVGDPANTAGGLLESGAQPVASDRALWLLQRKAGKPGRGLGKTTGWIHRAALQSKGVQMWGGVGYDRLTPQGLQISRDGAEMLLPVDTVVLCAGQVPERRLADALAAAGIAAHVIGGADVAAELDAKRAIDQGTRLAATL